MKPAHVLFALGLALLGQAAPKEEKPMPRSAPAATSDPNLWLEDIHGAKAMAWVHARNEETEKALQGTPTYRKLQAGILEILDSKARIPSVTLHGKWLYNYWQDAKHPRGIWRRTTLAEYRKPHPAWETVLDMDALDKAEHATWIFHGAQFLKPECRLCLVSLSPGGSDASVVREFDVDTRTFVKDGFQLPQAKSEVSWVNKDEIFVGTDFGPGSLTTSGYPRIAKLWKRGTPLSAAKEIFAGEAGDVAASVYHDATPGFERDFAVRSPTFFTTQTFLLGKDGQARKIEVPDDAETSVHREWLLVKPRTDWKVDGRTYPAGCLLATPFDAFMAGKRDLTVLFEPTAHTALEAYGWTRHRLILNVLDDVKSRLYLLTPHAGTWKREPMEGVPEIGTASAWALDPDHSDDYFLDVAGFLTPDTLYLGSPGRAPEALKASPAFFDPKGLEVTQHFATSQDGTRIPYFQVSRKGLQLDGSNPTLLNGYGGFEVSMLPSYSGVRGLAWLEKGGVFVLANIRGGGEYGPKWHEAAIKQDRPKAYQDFAAVAEDLIARKVTSPARLACIGGSNGGLLVGNMLTQYPQLFGAIVCQVPLLDMKRYTHLLAGASWMGEYGDPDKPDQWAYIKTFSPYQNVKAGVKYPPTFFMTTTRDDRVDPGHARKMMAKMMAMGDNVRFFENTEGGHGAGADNRQSAHFWALAYTFLWNEIGQEHP